ncbi:MULTISPECIES: hypothetical protein [Pseudomonas]|uniref:hypothetical protein n=1 Tax=Pseudomonas TaxID=286 RepID=UPI0016451614|nr:MULTISPECIES: hypothetical protein [Pseudomonas]MBC3258066.1 hypothetical protein [Pseudomonas paralactis]MBL4980478.1 hypothetical protein [Pseudomonas fluorescens]MBW9238519.1 hypothetical protein [Pseudomonas carnis]
MAVHSKKEVEELVHRFAERYEALVKVMRGKETENLTASGIVPGLSVKPADIRFAVDDVATALKEIKSRLGKG